MLWISDENQLWRNKWTRLLEHIAATAILVILIISLVWEISLEDKIQDLPCCHFQENFCIYSGISVSCHFYMIYLWMYDFVKKKWSLQILIPQYKDFNTKIVPDYLTRYFRFPIISHHRIKGSTLEDHYPQKLDQNLLRKSTSECENSAP